MLITATAWKFSVFVDISTTCPTSQDQNLLTNYTHALEFFESSLIFSHI